MPKEKHTPLPWMLGDSDPLQIIGATTRFRGIGNPQGHELVAVAVIDPSDNAEEDQANARLIKRACNSHYNLLAVARAYVELLERHPEHLIEDDLPGLPDTLDFARATIASAEGEDDELSNAR